MTSQVFRDGLLEGQVAIVTGGGSGFGRVTALELGAQVVVIGRRPERAAPRTVRLRLRRRRRGRPPA